MYTVSYTILYDVIYVYTTFYMMYIMNTTCTLIHQTSIVTGHTNLQEKTYTYDMVHLSPLLMFFSEARFSPRPGPPYSLKNVRIFIQDFMDWTTLVTLAAESSTNGSQSP